MPSGDTAPAGPGAARGTRMLNPSTGVARVCLVTGSASPRGLGAAMAEAFAREGGKVIISDLAMKEVDGKKAVESLNARYGAGTAIWVGMDVTKEEDWQRAIAEIDAAMGPLDVCCNNAGIATQADMRNAKLSEFDMDDFDRMMAINLRGVVLGTKYAAKSMAKNTAEEWRSIINTSSVAGLTAGGLPAYSTSKWSVRGWTKNAAVLGASEKIRVNSVHPGAIKSDMTQSLDWLDSDFKPAGNGQALAARHSLNRFGEPSEVANVCLLLASPEGSFLTGQEFVVDGGLHRS
ncbi:short-chain dehydrogenase/reductase SDR [Hyaloraphidium curvatum]|nr:short-chain dehydrogenase/reductase SDR [Hyaloraphidium curvatum]